MDDLLEKVAREICRANCIAAYRSQEDTECQVENGWDLWLPEARAIIPIVMEDAARVLDRAEISDLTIIGLREGAELIRSRVLDMG